MKDLKHIQSFNEHQENLNISDVRSSKKFDNIKLDLSKKFGQLDIDFLNSLSDKELLQTAIYNYIYEIELISRKYDGSLSGDVEVDEKYLENFLSKTTQYISDLNNFFEGIK